MASSRKARERKQAVSVVNAVFATREKLQALKRKFVDVDLSEYLGAGQTMRVWNLTARDRLFYITSLVDTGKEGGVDVTGARTRLLLLTLGDEQGNRLFKDGEE